MDNNNDAVGQNNAVDHDETIVDERDQQIGRAIVRDDDSLNAYYQDLDGLNTGALWQVANDIEPWEPVASSDPVLWPYDRLREQVMRSLDLVSPEQAGRRVVYLRNPKRQDVSAACGWLFSGIQVMRPGERATAHRHAASALRFVMEGAGAYTVVDGHRLTMDARDFVLTPNGCWHEHGIEESGETSMWQDGLDIPLTNALEANSYEIHPDLYQSGARPTNQAAHDYGAPGLLPALDKWDKPFSPLLKYAWEPSFEGLMRHAQHTDGSDFDGAIMRYINPQDGGHVMQTMGAHLQWLRPGERTQSHRHTGNVIYHVAQGSGYSIINGKRFDWKEKDIFCVPTWMWHEHANASTTDGACLFSFNDFPTMEKLGFYREQAYTDNGGHQIATS